VALGRDRGDPALGREARREFRVTVLNNAKTASSASVRLETPAGWTVEPKQAKVELRFEGEEVNARSSCRAGLKAGEFEVKAVVTRRRGLQDGYQTTPTTISRSATSSITAARPS
jgi:hypothetical protein